MTRHNTRARAANKASSRRQVDVEDAASWAYATEKAHLAGGGYERRLYWPRRSGDGILALADVRVQGSGVAGMLSSATTPADAEVIVMTVDELDDPWLLRHHALTGGRPAWPGHATITWSAMTAATNLTGCRCRRTSRGSSPAISRTALASIAG